MNKACQYFTPESLNRGRELSVEETVRFLEEFRINMYLIHATPAELKTEITPLNKLINSNNTDEK